MQLRLCINNIMQYHSRQQIAVQKNYRLLLSNGNVKVYCKQIFIQSDFNFRVKWDKFVCSDLFSR